MSNQYCRIGKMVSKASLVYDVIDLVVERLKYKVANKNGIPLIIHSNDLCSTSRKVEYVFARNIVVYLSLQRGASVDDIAIALNQHRSSAYHQVSSFDIMVSQKHTLFMQYVHRVPELDLSKKIYFPNAKSKD